MYSCFIFHKHGVDSTHLRHDRKAENYLTPRRLLTGNMGLRLTDERKEPRKESIKGACHSHPKDPLEA